MKYNDIDASETNMQQINQIEYHNKNKNKVLKNTIYCLAVIILGVANVLIVFDLLNVPFAENAIRTIKNIFSGENQKSFEIVIEKMPSDILIQYKNQIATYYGVDNIVYSTCCGKVSNITTNNQDKKDVDIVLDDMCIHYQNLTYVGVSKGEIVKMSQPLAYLKQGDLMYFWIEKNNQRCELGNIKL